VPKVVSQRQARFFRAVASGSIRVPGLSKATAEEMVGSVPTHNLPKTAKTPKVRRK
jgi:hypothetical protein